MALNVFQEVTLISSLVTNILGTGLISLKAWYAWGSRLGKANITEPEIGRIRRYRRWIVTDLQRVVNKKTRAERVLALIVESGMFYIFSGVRVIVSLLINFFAYSSLISQSW